MLEASPMRPLAWRLVAGGLLVALAVAASGGAIERARFGSTDDEALARVETELRRQFDTNARALTELAARVRAGASVIRAASRDPAEARRLFDVVSDALAQEQAGPAGITVYDAENRPVAWAGRVSDLAKQLVSGPETLVMVPGALGPRLVHVEPVEDTAHHDLARDATIVVEQSVADLEQTAGLADTARLSTSLAPAAGKRPVDPRTTLLLSALTVAGLVRLVIALLERRRTAMPRPQLRVAEAGGLGDLRLGALYLAAGALTATILVAYERFLRQVVEQTDLDVLHFSLHPLVASRIAIGFALVLLHAAVIWGTATLVKTIRVYWRTPRELRLRLVASFAWLAGAAFAAALLNLRLSSLPLGPLSIALAAAGGCAVVLTALPRRARRRSHAGRLVALFAGFAVPAIAMYPSLLSYATASKERLIATRYAPRAASQRTEAQEGLTEALDQIDAMPALVDFVRSTQTPTTDSALAVWRNTSLATSRLTSAIELYDADGALVSR